MPELEFSVPAAHFLPLPMMKTAIGIDIGGTKISMAVGNANGKILAHREIPTRTGSETRRCLEALAQNLKALIAESGVSKNRISGIGVGIPGPVDSRKGVVPCSPHLPGWTGFALRRWLEKKIGIRAVMANDANAAALGEKKFGQGRGLRHFIYMTISTGIGGGIVVNSKLLEGSGFAAGEVGHMTIVTRGDRCGCGKRGCLEAYASGTAIANFAARELKRGRRSAAIRALMRQEPLSAKILGLAARQGDGLARAVFRRAGVYLGVGVANLLNILNPEKIILGGGVLQSAPPEFWQSMLASCRCEAWPQSMRSVRIVRSTLKKVGDLGALALVFEGR